MDTFDSRRADELATLLALYEQGSFAAAGRQLERHPTVLSKRLSALETRLGIRLVERSTRQLRFTDEGERLVAKVLEASRLIAEAEEEAAEGAATVRGRLRLALPAAMGRRWLSGMLADFVLAYPQVIVETEYADRFVDLIGEGFDAAIRIGELADNRLVASKLCDHVRILCASPQYLARHGEPAQPEDLAAHNCLGFNGLRSFPEWRLMSDTRQTSVKVAGSLRSNDNEALLEAARRGVGIVAGGDWLMGEDLASGCLVRVLAQWQLDKAAGIYLVRPTARLNTAAMGVFKAWLEDRFKAGPPWRR
ncbi:MULTISPECIES: LysR family transcriptional regulator [Pseudomonas]|uniref:Transcriptional regulator, LysR family n=2 Tax=Pseudomonas putida group TaxID=136845 RepID=Q88GW2_PSEPK|nr:MULTISPECIES: LysR family transcriptional regulator [Pseudomonas]AAN69205.1 Transcriptional regulator, LysR family [Pseudomonas putida KT2440]KMU93917.1 LysR family transcriptional regulator [Pseudomonas putida]MBP2843583.1 LysR family transcriptional regulator [Pseudomonas sp. PNP]MCE0865389.1 LysR family transcriptional regulator [Pseudomonas alloputida]MCE0871146.1 LysR family transcriptional regulator [Pseudomonas alloputida]